jgi:hypothetical protein
MPAQPSAPEEQNIKGIALRRLMENCEHFYGADAARRVLERLPEPVGNAVRFGRVVPGGWYPIAWLKTMHKVVQEVTGTGPEVSRKFGRRTGQLNFTTVHRVFLSVLAPEWVMKRAARMFRLYVERGDMRVVDSRDGMARAVFRGCRGFDRSIWEATLGQCEAVLALCGAKNIRMRIESGGGDGDDDCEAIAYWT